MQSMIPHSPSSELQDGGGILIHLLQITQYYFDLSTLQNHGEQNLIVVMLQMMGIKCSSGAYA